MRCSCRALTATTVATVALVALPGLAYAQQVSFDAESVSTPSGSLSNNSAENIGSVVLSADATGRGSVDTSGSSLLGEPTTASLGPLADLVTESAGSVDVRTPSEGSGSVDTTGSALGEPTTGSLEPVYTPLAGSLGINEGATLVVDETTLLLPVVVAGSIAAGLAFAPQIQQALAAAGIALPPLP